MALSFFTRSHQFEVRLQHKSSSKPWDIMQCYVRHRKCGGAKYWWVSSGTGSNSSSISSNYNNNRSIDPCSTAILHKLTVSAGRETPCRLQNSKFPFRHLLTPPHPPLFLSEATPSSSTSLTTLLIILSLLLGHTPGRFLQSPPPPCD